MQNQRWFGAGLSLKRTQNMECVVVVTEQGLDAEGNKIPLGDLIAIGINPRPNPARPDENIYDVYLWPRPAGYTGPPPRL